MTDPALSIYSYFDPGEFKNYSPKKCSDITPFQLSLLQPYLQFYPHRKRHLPLFFLYFVTDMPLLYIHHFVGTDPQDMNGVIEAFRYGCKKYLRIENDISDFSMKEFLWGYMQNNYELLLVGRTEGISILSNKLISGKTVSDAVEHWRDHDFYAYIQKLDYEPIQKPGKNILPQQIRKVAQNILTLPELCGCALILYHVFGYSIEIIEENYKIAYPVGMLNYARQRLSELLEMKQLISISCIKRACELFYEKQSNRI